MGRRQPLPDEFDGAFSVRIAKASGVGRGRLRGTDLESPFHGVRATPNAGDPGLALTDPYERQRRARVARARLYAPRLHFGHFYSHQTAVSIWGGPLPLEFADDDMVMADEDLALHITARGHVPFPRAKGTTGHRTLLSLTSVTEHDGLRVSSPASTWAMLGTLPLIDLIALGDYFCREWRSGYGRPDTGRPPLATRDALRAALDAGRRRGAARLREALESIREDSWSPRETRVRCILVAAGLPEPELNIDVFDESGVFLGCVDMAYPGEKVAVEYLGMLHGQRWAEDVERLAALRAAGWTVIEVTAPLLRRPADLVRRVSAALGR
ncbi:endonuclease domain-containing protein [Microbacterium sp. A588]